MSRPLRVSDKLFKEAELEGSLMNRSAANQVEFWADIGKRIAHSISSSDMLALMQGIAKVQIDVSGPEYVVAEQVFDKVEEANVTYQLGNEITQGRMYYEASITDHGLLDRVMPGGQRQAGHFESGVFIVK